MAEGPGELNPAVAGIYNATRAALEFSLQNKLGEGNLAKANANTNFNFARGNVVRQEPQRFQANRNAANSQGLAESGVLAQTQQRQAAGYNQQLGGLAQQRAQAVQRITTGEQNATQAHSIGEIGNLANAKKEQLDYLLANPPQEATPSTPNGSPTSNLLAGYTAKTQKGGSVSISPSGPPTVTGGKAQPVTGGLRKKAVYKVKSGWGY